MYRGAIIGFGNVACQAHLPAWRGAAAFRIVAAVDPDPARLALARTRAPEMRCYKHLDTMFEHEEVDFVDICTPPAMHAPLILQACARGMHVLCEKPLTLSAKTFRQIAVAAAAAGVLIFPVHNWKYAPLFQMLKALLEAGEIGMPTYIELTTLRTKPAGTSGWRVDPTIAGGGILMDHGWHLFYLLLHLLGEIPQSITARLETRRWQQAAVEDTATCEVAFPHTQARIYLTWAAQQRRNTGIIRGPKGEIRLEDRQLVVQENGHMSRHIVLSEALSAGSYHPSWFASLLPDFQTVLQDPPQYGAELHEAETCLNLTLLAYRSATLNAQTLPYARLLGSETP